MHFQIAAYPRSVAFSLLANASVVHQSMFSCSGVGRQRIPQVMKGLKRGTFKSFKVEAVGCLAPTESLQCFLKRLARSFKMEMEGLCTLSQLATGRF